MLGLLREVSRAVDPDRALQLAMGGLIEATAARAAVAGPREAWRPGKPLKLYLAGYVGARNTGADVRVEEMIRQLRHLVGDAQLEMTLPAFDQASCSSYFRAVRHATMPVVFPAFLAEHVPRHHGVVACEGSMFKSKFSNALSTMMAGALGLAGAEGKLAVGYGAEAGDMDRPLQKFVERNCRSAYVLCRNLHSRPILERLGVRTGPGADTAWTFEPAAAEHGRRLLEGVGWDGERPVLAVAPINPFWWPVRPDLLRAAARALGGAFAPPDGDHYKSVYFHHSSEEARARYQAYIRGLAEGVAAFSREHRPFVVLIGMEQLDRRACEDLAAALPAPPPCLVSDELDMYELVAVLRTASLLLSSRFHAIVCSMPGMVPSAGVTMDERIRNLLVDRGDADLVLDVEDDDLGERVLGVLRRLQQDAESIVERTGRSLPGHLRGMGEMGRLFLDELQRVYPEMPRVDRPSDWLHHLPPLSQNLEGILETYA